MYRAFINQPSKFQPFHRFHGKYCIAEELKGLQNTVRVYFTEGAILSMRVPKNCISRVYLSNTSKGQFIFDQDR